MYFRFGIAQTRKSFQKYTKSMSSNCPNWINFKILLSLPTVIISSVQIARESCVCAHMYMHMYVPTFAYPYRNQKLTLTELTKLASALQGSVSDSACNLEITCEVLLQAFVSS